MMAEQTLFQDLQENELFKKNFSKLDWYNPEMTAKCFLIAFEEMNFVNQKLEDKEIGKMLDFDESYVEELKYYLNKFEINPRGYISKIGALINILGRNQIKTLILTYNREVNRGKGGIFGLNLNSNYF